jgi:hypothetical protein
VPRGAYEIRRARKEHRCIYAWYCYIQPGAPYLYAACPPEHDCNRSERWDVFHVCLRHVEEYYIHTDKTRAQADRLKGGMTDDASAPVSGG